MRTSRTSSGLSWILPLGLLTSAAAAQNLPAGDPLRPESFGPKLTVISYPSAGFIPISPTSPFFYDNDYYLYSTGAIPCFLAPVQLPSGVEVVFMALEACHTGGAQVSAILERCDQASPTGACTVIGSVVSSGPTGCGQFGSDPLSDEISNSAHSYFLRVCTTSQTSDTRFRTLKLAYFLRVSPAPATATFADVPTTHLYFRAIEALAASGITSGCGNGNFCPEQAVTRGEVAKFLANALGLYGGP